MTLVGRFVAINGSVSAKADVELVRRCHRAVRSATRELLKAGAGIVTSVGAEDLLIPGDADTARVFFGTVLDEVHHFANEPRDEGKSFEGPIVKVVCTQKLHQQMPRERSVQLRALVDAHAAHIKHLRAGWNTGAYLREHQAREGDALVVLGGGEGVEHLASLYVQRSRPVIPLDPKLGSFHDDGNGGAAMLHGMALEKPQVFVQEAPERLPGELLGLSLQHSGADPIEVGTRLVRLLERVIKPRVFFVRVTNPDVRELESVNAFFQDVVRPEVERCGFTPYEVGRSPSRDALIHREIFDQIHHAAVVVADLTGDRPNNFVELGYALGRGRPVIVTAKHGTTLPFDVNALPVFFWKPEGTIEERRARFHDFWDKNIRRPPIVPPRELI